MKRRNADCGKLRRPIKRNKMTEGMYGSNTLLYMKFFILWAIVITADFILEFRFEFLWPFWLLLRSVHDSFKYKGLAFSVLFVCIAITSDLVCLFFIPVHWLFFAASTYVWVQYVWHTDKGICLPTIILWMLFVYLEAAIRWKDSRHMPHLDLCRPFAAHCIGYPVVTLGFGFKSYVGYRIRQRKQREVAKENEFYMQLCRQALPQEEPIQDDLNKIQDPIDLQHKETAILSNSSTNHNSNFHKNAQLNSKNTSTCIQTANGTAAMHSSMSTPNGNVGSGAGHHNQNSHKNHRRSLDKDRTSTTTAAAISTDTQHNNSSTSLKSSLSSSTDMTNASQKNHTSYHQNNHHSSYNRDTSKSSSTTDSSSSTTTTTTSIKEKNSERDKSDSHNNLRTNKDMDKESKLSNFEYHQQQLVSSTTNNHNNSMNSTTCGVISSKSIDNKTAINGKITASNNNNNAAATDAKHNDNNNVNSKICHNNQNHNNSSWSTTADTNSGGSSNEHLNTTTVNLTAREKGSKSHGQQNGGILHMDVEFQNDSNNSTHEVTEKTKGRRNRVKQKDTNHIHYSSKDNHQQNHSHNPVSNSNNIYSQSANNNSGSGSADNIGSNSDQQPQQSNKQTATVQQICESCQRLENELKKLKTDISHMKQVENELRQKMESASTVKSNLQAKQKENEELDKRIQDMMTSRQADRQTMQNSERRLGDERRQRQSLESQLNLERKQRKQAEEKATRMECGEACKQRKLQLEAECKQLRRDFLSAEESRKSSDQQNRQYEQEIRQFEVEFRNREAREGTEVLMSALGAMQEKNTTLEKNLSAETRVKLDLFSALGEAKRQLEIRESMIRSKDKEVLELKSKIAQLFAVTPSVSNDSFCMTPCPTTGISLLRLNDTSALQGPSSPMTHISLGGSPLINQLQNMAVFTSSATTSVSATVVAQSLNQQQQQQQSHHLQQQQLQHQQTLQQQQLQHQQQQAASQLDPNATAYTPKNLVGGAEA